MYGISSSVVKSNGLNFVLVGGTACCNTLHRECYQVLVSKIFRYVASYDCDT